MDLTVIQCAGPRGTPLHHKVPTGLTMPQGEGGGEAVGGGVGFGIPERQHLGHLPFSPQGREEIGS